MDSPSLTEEEMTEIKKDVLTRLRHYLGEKIRVDRHLDFLRSRRILTRDDAEYISSRSTQKKKAGVLLDMLSENPQGLDVLLDSIRENKSQNFIIVKITDEVQKAKNEKMESLRASLLVSPSDSDSSVHTLSDASVSFGNDSTLLFHPDGERSSASSLCTPSLTKGVGLTHAYSEPSSSSLPRPGDPGAPPLPEQDEAGACTSSGDSNIQPLRSRSLLLPHNVF